MIISAPLEERYANNKIALIEDTIPRQPLLRLRSKSYLEQLYSGRHLSVREIAGKLNQHLIPTKNDRIWQANTVRKILARV